MFDYPDEYESRLVRFFTEYLKNRTFARK